MSTYTSNFLRAKRAELGLSRRGLAQRVGVSDTQIARYEHGADPTLQVASRLAEALGVTLDELVSSEAVA